jgi:hypothetical protein
MYAGVAGWVDAQDLKSAPRGFGKCRTGAESPFFVLRCEIQRSILKYTDICRFVWSLDTSMDTKWMRW